MANGIVIEDRRLVYWFVPKAACTSVKRLIAEHLGMRIPDKKGEIHTLPFKRALMSEAAGMKEYTHFTVVRHPMARLLSLYNNKIFRDKRNTALVRDGVTAPIFAPYGGKFHADMSFPDFVRAIVSVLDKPNIHFQRQSEIVPDVNMLTYKVEDMGELSAFFQMKGVHQKMPHENKTNTEGWESHYTPELAAIVEQSYRVDFERFDYKNPFV